MAPFRIPDLTMAERAAILTYMDARLDPAAYAGLQEGDAHVIRNAGGRASDDAIRSLVISYKLLGTQEWYVIHHSNCGIQRRRRGQLICALMVCALSYQVVLPQQQTGLLGLTSLG